MPENDGGGRKEGGGGRAGREVVIGKSLSDNPTKAAHLCEAQEKVQDLALAKVGLRLHRSAARGLWDRQGSVEHLKQARKQLGLGGEAVDRQDAGVQFGLDVAGGAEAHVQRWTRCWWGCGEG